MHLELMAQNVLVKHFHLISFEGTTINITNELLKTLIFEIPDPTFRCHFFSSCQLHFHPLFLRAMHKIDLAIFVTCQ